jgi:hypothetical protein
MQYHPIYGGPCNGQASAGSVVSCDRTDVLPSFRSADAPGKKMPIFYYDLRDVVGGRAFLPREDGDLLAAYQDTGGTGPAAEALLGEIGRRHLSI